MTWSTHPAATIVGTMSREFASRTSDGILVRLLWHPDDGHVSVNVNDPQTRA